MTTTRHGQALGPWRLETLIGRGGFGDVWRARSSDNARVAAVKVVREGAASAWPRFVREAAAVGRVESPQVCALIDARLSGPRDGYLAYELLAGESLEHVLAREASLSLAAALVPLADVLRAIVAAHAAGVVHRDVKPANVFLTGDEGEAAKLLDFGAAKVAGEPEGALPDAGLTTDAAVLGSLAYMAPEQVDDPRGVDGRADVYAAAATGFATLTGRPPLRAPSAASLITLKLSCDAPSLADATGERWPAAFERFFARALARDPARRFASAAAALDAWGAAAERFAGAGAPR